MAQSARVAIGPTGTTPLASVLVDNRLNHNNQRAYVVLSTVSAGMLLGGADVSPTNGFPLPTGPSSYVVQGGDMLFGIGTTGAGVGATGLVDVLVSGSPSSLADVTEV